MWQRRIGDTEVGAIGLGCLPMSIESRPGDEQSIRTIHAALDAGVTLVDTADVYHLHTDPVGHNESLVARGLASYGGDRSRVLVATKGGIRHPAADTWVIDGSPRYLREACEASLARLEVEAIGLYQLHRPDPEVPYAESVGAVRDLLDAGKIRMAGISNVDSDQLRTAYDVLGGRLSSVQNQFSPASRDAEPVLALCTELNIAFLPWSPLGGVARASDLAGQSGRFAEVAAAHGVSPQRVCLAWLLTRSPVMVPIPGASRPESIQDSAAAADLILDPAELAALDAR